MKLPDNLPLLAICGFSGAGKTTVVEELVRRLTTAGLRIAVIKHDAHRLDMDRPGKDSDRFFQAGATIAVHDRDQFVLRLHKHEQEQAHLENLVRDLARSHDLVIVEGHKDTALPMKVWLRRDAEDAPPPEVGPVVLDLGRELPRVELVEELLNVWLPKQWQRRPVRGAILLGGESRRMGEPKHLLRHGPASWLACVQDALGACLGELVLLGSGELPPDVRPATRLPDAPELQGPLAGLLAAMRWAPDYAWIVAACDQPLLTADAIAWLLAQRRPGVRAILPRHPVSGRIDPFPGLYEPCCRPLLEQLDGPAKMAGLKGVISPVLPDQHLASWANFNTPEAAAAISF